MAVDRYGYVYNTFSCCAICVRVRACVRACVFMYITPLAVVQYVSVCVRACVRADIRGGGGFVLVRENMEKGLIFLCGQGKVRKRNMNLPKVWDCFFSPCMKIVCT